MANQEEFCPRVYNFSLSKEFADSAQYWNLNSYKVEQPSFSILLDHTLAVMWHVFNNEGAELYSLNRADIAWALRFLEAIDTSHIVNKKDLDKLIEYFRKILITRYALEEVEEFSGLNKTMKDKTFDGNDSFSSSFDEFYHSTVVREDSKLLKKQPKINESKCSEDDILNHLKKLNPDITTFEDVIARLLQQQPTQPET